VTRTIKPRALAAAGAFLLVLSVTGCAGFDEVTANVEKAVAAESAGEPAPKPKQHEPTLASLSPDRSGIFWVALPGDEKVLCISAESTYSDATVAISCDWSHIVPIGTPKDSNTAEREAAGATISTEGATP
jgi:hypothetical protein